RGRGADGFFPEIQIVMQFGTLAIVTGFLHAVGQDLYCVYLKSALLKLRKVKPRFLYYLLRRIDSRIQFAPDVFIWFEFKNYTVRVDFPPKVDENEFEEAFLSLPEFIDQILTETERYYIVYWHDKKWIKY